MYWPIEAQASLTLSWPRRYRPTEVDFLLGDSSKARAKLGWRHRTSFDALVSDMVKANMAAVLAERERRNRHA
jgi:GDPmannose 4,6-dehydratase